MRNLKFFSLLLMLSLAPVEAVFAQDLSRYRWQSRLLLVFTESLAAPPWQTQLAALQAEVDALVERRLQILVITTDAVWRLDFSDATASALLPATDLPEAARLRSAYQLAQTSAVLLLGLDGEVKARYALPVALGAVFAEIDQMPMRQWELQQR
jgi:hypothetical protein